MATFNMLYASQLNWSVKEYSALYFVLNKAVMNEQDFLKLLDPNLMTNTTKAMIKAHINHYEKHHLYTKFPNLKKIQNQRALCFSVVVADKIKLNTNPFLQMNIID